jgi:hypothetical protein
MTLDRSSYSISEIVDMSGLRERTILRMFRTDPSARISRDRLVIANALDKIFP